MVGVWHSLRSALQNTPSLRVSGRAPACRVSQEGERGFLQMQAVTLTRGLVTQPMGETPWCVWPYDTVVGWLWRKRVLYAFDDEFLGPCAKYGSRPNLQSAIAYAILAVSFFAPKKGKNLEKLTSVHLKNRVSDPEV